MLKFALIFEQLQKYVRRESGMAMQLAGSAETRDRYHWNRLVNACVFADGKAVREFLSHPSLTVFAVVFAIFGDEAAAEDQWKVETSSRGVFSVQEPLREPMHCCGIWKSFETCTGGGLFWSRPIRERSDESDQCA